MSKYFIK